MAARAIWKAHIRFGKVDVPVNFIDERFTSSIDMLPGWITRGEETFSEEELETIIWGADQAVLGNTKANAKATKATLHQGK